MQKEKETCNLLIREFPVELAEKCLSASGEKVLTRSVLKLIYGYFELSHEYQKMKLKAQDLESDVLLFRQYLEFQNLVEKKRSDVLKILSDPNRFYLHGE